MSIVFGNGRQGIAIEVPEEVYKAFRELSRRGDARCKYKIEDRVMKAAGEAGDLHVAGHKGIIKGALYSTDKRQGAYFVLFDGEKEEVAIVEEKLILIL